MNWQSITYRMDKFEIEETGIGIPFWAHVPEMGQFKAVVLSWSFTDRIAWCIIDLTQPRIRLVE